MLLSHREFRVDHRWARELYPGSSQDGVAAILATADSCICFTNSIEAARFSTEELAGTGIDVVSYPWFDRGAGKKKLVELVASRKIAADVEDDGEFDRLARDS